MTSARQELLTAQLRAAMSKAERREVVNDYLGVQKSTSEVRHEQAFRRYLASGDASELRAAADSTSPAGQYEGTMSAGGYLTPVEFHSQIVQATKEYSAVFDDFQLASTPNGRATNYATNSVVTLSASILSETFQVQEQDVTFGQIQLPDAYTYSTGVQLVSHQLAEDALYRETATGGAPGSFDLSKFLPAPVNAGLSTWLAQRVGEILGRGIAAHAIAGTGTAQPLGLIPFLNSAGAWSAGNSGGYYGLTAATVTPTVTNASGTELGQNVLSIQTLSAIIGAIDPSYWPRAKWYFNPQQWAQTLLLADSSKRPLLEPVAGGARELLGFPVVISNTIPNLTASTTGGPVFGDLSRAMLHRVVDGTWLKTLRERYADFGQIGYIGFQRHDFRGLDSRAAVTVKAAAT